jgi:hypothetical protein
MLIHEIIINYINDKKINKKYLNIMYILGIALILFHVVCIIFYIPVGIISFLLIALGFFLLFPKKIYDNYEYEKNNPHKTPIRSGLGGLPGYIYLLAGAIFIFAFLFVLLVERMR